MWRRQRAVKSRGSACPERYTKAWLYCPASSHFCWLFIQYYSEFLGWGIACSIRVTVHPPSIFHADSAPDELLSLEPSSASVRFRQTSESERQVPVHLRKSAGGCWWAFPVPHVLRAPGYITGGRVGCSHCLCLPYSLLAPFLPEQSLGLLKVCGQTACEEAKKRQSSSQLVSSFDGRPLSHKKGHSARTER